MSFRGPNLVSWAYSKQKVVSRLSAESEYRSLVNSIAELAEIKYVLKELTFHLKIPPLLLCGNTSATHLVENHVMPARTKYMEIDYHFVHESHE